MIEFLNESVLWWHWIVLGIILIIVDMTFATFFILALGAAAVFVGVIDVILFTTFTSELSLWILFSILVIMAWFRWFKQDTSSKSGQSNYGLDTLGTVTEEIQPHSRGKVTFDTPVLGNTSWLATSKTDIDTNTRVKIVQINGQLIEVEPLQHT